MTELVDPTTGELVGGMPGGEESFDETAGDCPRCDSYRQALEGVATDVEMLEREKRSLARRLKAVEDDLKQVRQEAPEHATVLTIFRTWVTLTKRNPKTAKLGAKREGAVLARLREGHSAERILRAVEGVALAPTTSSAETQRLAALAALAEARKHLDDEAMKSVEAVYREQSKRLTVYDDLELVCRNEVNVEKFAALADRIAPRTSVH